MAGVFLREKFVTTEAEMGVMQPQAKGHIEPPGRHREGLSTRVSQRKLTLLKPRFRSLASLNVSGYIFCKSLSLC